MPSTMGGPRSQLGNTTCIKYSRGTPMLIERERVFKMKRKVSGRGFILLGGVWIHEALKVHIVNIYSPCDIHNKRILWDTIKQLKNLSLGGL